MLSVSAVAERLGVTERRVRAMIAAGRLPAERVGRAWVIDDAALARIEGRRPVGRPLGEATAWRELLGEAPAPEFDAGVLRARYRHRAQVQLFDSPALAAAVADGTTVVGGWSAAVHHDPLLDDEPGVPLVRYLGRGALPAWRDRHWAVPSPLGPIVVCVVADDVAAELAATGAGPGARIVPARVAAVDLAEMGGVRRIEAAQRLWSR